MQNLEGPGGQTLGRFMPEKPPYLELVERSRSR
jgi:hypothetical protein